MKGLLLLAITEADRAHLEEIALASLIDSSEALKGLSAERNPNSYPQARARVTSAARLYLEAQNSPEEVGGPGYDYRPAVDHVDGLPHTLQEQRAMLDAGLLPMKELGPHDPRAYDPVCRHGRKFSEDCADCAISDGVAAAASQGEGFDGNGSPVP